MSLPGMGDDGAVQVKRRFEYDNIMKDILDPPKTKKGGKNRWTAVLLQLVFGYVGAGYYYLDERVKALASAVVVILGALFVVYLEIRIFPSETEVNYPLMPLQYVVYVVFSFVVLIYFTSVYDCYRIGSLHERGKTAGIEMGGSKELTREERLEKVFSEHDTRGSDEGVAQ